MSDQSPNQPGTPDPDDDAVGSPAAAGSQPPPAADTTPPAAEPPPAAAATPPPPPAAATPPPPQGGAAPPPPPPAGGAAPPPPPPGGYAAPPAGYQAAYGGPPAPARPTLTIGDAFSYGWKGFTSNVGAVLLIVLVVVVVGVGLNALAAVIDNGFLSFLVSLVAFVVGFVLALGVIRAALTITDGERPSVGEVFQGDGVLQYILASIVLGAAFTVLNILGIITLVLFPITLIVTWVLAFFVQFFGYAILDENTGAFNGISRSFDLVKNNLGELILLWLVALGINILGALLCGIGLLVTVPVTAIAWAYAWRQLTGGVVVPQA